MSQKCGIGYLFSIADFNQSQRNSKYRLPKTHFVTGIFKRTFELLN
jgi:hypothetical protein